MTLDWQAVTQLQPGEMLFLEGSDEVYTFLERRADGAFVLIPHYRMEEPILLDAANLAQFTRFEDGEAAADGETPSGADSASSGEQTPSGEGESGAKSANDDTQDSDDSSAGDSQDGDAELFAAPGPLEVPPAGNSPSEGDHVQETVTRKRPKYKGG